MLYQNKNNTIRQYTDIDKDNGLIPNDFKQLTDKQFKAYSNQPNNYSVWNGNEWVEDEILKNESIILDKKAEKNLRLSEIVVTTTNGNVFDGNETARNNMLSAIVSAELINKTEEYWKLADNSTKLVTLDELKEALLLSIQEVGNIVKDY